MDLNIQQKEAAYYDGDAENILVIAGAGTGKTTTIIGRIVYLVENKKIPPSRILALTFTNKSAKELVSRISVEVGEAELVNACTFHSFCIQVIKTIPKSFGYGESPPFIIDQAGQDSLMLDSLGSVLSEIEDSDYLEDIKALIPKPKKINELYSYSRNSMIDFEKYVYREFTEEPVVIAIMKETVRVYEEQKKEYGYADFDDLLHRFVEVLEKKPDLAEHISRLYDEVLVDELQDTNPIQYRILKSLGTYSRLFGVGDPAQSIYGFRGADFKSIYNFSKVFKNNVTIPLSENYRSTQEILDFSNLILKKSTLKYTNELFSPNGYSGEAVKLFDFDSGIEEAKFVAQDIIDYVQENNGSFKDVFIIARSAFSAKEVEAMMNRYQVPYVFIGGQSIMKTAHVQDLLSILRFGIAPNDKLACIRFLGLFKGVGTKTASKFYNKIQDISGDAEAISDEIVKTVKKDPDTAANLYLSVTESEYSNINPIKSLINNGFITLIKNKYPDSYEYRVKDIEMFSDFFKQYGGDIKSFINDFTIEPDVYKVQDAEDEDEDKVTLITAHSSKGLERKRCYIINATPGNFPSKRSIGDKDSEEEERRVFYVASTRAKESLILTRNMQYMDYVFRNAVTSVDYVKDTIGLLEKNNKKVNTGVSGLSSLRDIF